MKTGRRILFLAITTAIVLSSIGCQTRGAAIEDAIMIDRVDEQGQPGEEVVSYPADAAMLYSYAKLTDAPEHTRIKIVWTYVTNGKSMYELTLDSGTRPGVDIIATYAPPYLLPAGDYQVAFYIDEREAPDKVAKFIVAPYETAADEEQAAVTESARLDDVHMTSYVDEDGVPVDTILTAAPMGTWVVSAILRNPAPDTSVRIVWYDANDVKIDSVTLNPRITEDSYIFSTLELDNIAQDGIYHVELYIDDASAPSAEVEFAVKDIFGNVTQLSDETSLFWQKESGFSVEYPRGWIQINSVADEAAAFYPPEESENAPEGINVVLIGVIRDGAGGDDIETLLESWLSEIERGEHETYTLLDEGIRTVNGNEMARCIYRLKSEDQGTDGVVIQYFLVSGDDLYLITLTVTDDKYNELYPAVEKMALSFKLLH
ncbi:MAG: hypothetical protein GX417_08165 [Clostridiales bacterium]|nr:hypothetical protein [Clostridiales bacterium]